MSGDVTARLAEALRADGYRPATHAGILAALLPVVRELMAEVRKDEREAVLAYIARYTRDVLLYDDIARGVHHWRQADR